MGKTPSIVVHGGRGPLRPLELAVVVIAGLYPVAGVLAPRLKAVHALPLLAAGLTTVHLMVEGYRWQMVPIYSAVAVMAWVGWRLLRKPVPGLQIGRNEPSKIGLFALIPVVLGALPPALVPVPRLPEPFDCGAEGG